MTARLPLSALLLLVGSSALSEVVSVDVSEWAQTGTGVTPSGWTVTNIDAYADGSVRFDRESDLALSPEYRGIVTQLVMTIKPSSETTARFLTAIPVVANVGAGNLVAAATKAYEEQTFAWRIEDGVCRFRLQNATGTGNVGWGIRSLTVYLDRIEAPQDLREDAVWADALTVSWTPDPRAVSNEFELCRIVTVPPRYELLRDWDFTSLTNATGNSKTFRELDPPEELWDVGGVVIGLQKYDGGHLQIGNTDVGGVMALPLKPAVGRLAAMDLLRSDKDGNFSAVIGCVGPDGVTNECARISLHPESERSVVAIPDEAESLVIISERGDNRIRVEDVKVVTDYVPGSVTTNVTTALRTRKSTLTVKRLVAGDWIWRVRSFDAQGEASAWSPYRAVTISSKDPKSPFRGMAVVIR